MRCSSIVLRVTTQMRNPQSRGPGAAGEPGATPEAVKATVSCPQHRCLGGMARCRRWPPEERGLFLGLRPRLPVVAGVPRARSARLLPGVPCAHRRRCSGLTSPFLCPSGPVHVGTLPHTATLLLGRCEQPRTGWKTRREVGSGGRTQASDKQG